MLGFTLTTFISVARETALKRFMLAIPLPKQVVVYLPSLGSGRDVHRSSKLFSELLPPALCLLCFPACVWHRTRNSALTYGTMGKTSGVLLCVFSWGGSFSVPSHRGSLSVSSHRGSFSVSSRLESKLCSRSHRISWLDSPVRQ